MPVIPGTFNGTDGDDTIFSWDVATDSHRPVINGKRGNDLLIANDSDDPGYTAGTFLKAGEGNDVLRGNKSDNADILHGGAGNDRMVAGNGDTMEGNDGADIFDVSRLFSTSTARACITDGDWNPGEGDLIALPTGLTFANVSYVNVIDLAWAGQVAENITGTLIAWSDGAGKAGSLLIEGVNGADMTAAWFV